MAILPCGPESSDRTLPSLHAALTSRKMTGPALKSGLRRNSLGATDKGIAGDGNATPLVICFGGVLHLVFEQNRVRAQAGDHHGPRLCEKSGGR